jgi:hypothetical protein
MTDLTKNLLKFKRNADGDYVSDLASGLRIAPQYSRGERGGKGRVTRWYIYESSDVSVFKGKAYSATLSGCYEKINALFF